MNWAAGVFDWGGDDPWDDDAFDGYRDWLYSAEGDA